MIFGKKKQAGERDDRSIKGDGRIGCRPFILQYFFIAYENFKDVRSRKRLLLSSFFSIEKRNEESFSGFNGVF